MFKRKTGKLLTGICSTALAFSMVFTTAPMTFASSVEDSGTKTVEYAESTVLFESDYNDVPDYATNRSSPWSATWSTLLAGNAFPHNIDGNGFISYTQNHHKCGYIFCFFKNCFINLDHKKHSPRHISIILPQMVIIVNNIYVNFS